MKKKGSAFKKPKSARTIIKKAKTTTKYGYFPRDKQVCVLKNLGNCSFSLTIHHIEPRSEGGTNNRKNLMVLCLRHHMQWHHPSMYPKTKKAYLDYLKGKVNKV